jgi:hypothetical protein
VRKEIKLTGHEKPEELERIERKVTEQAKPIAKERFSAFVGGLGAVVEDLKTQTKYASAEGAQKAAGKTIMKLLAADNKVYEDTNLRPTFTSSLIHMQNIEDDLSSTGVIEQRNKQHVIPMRGMTGLSPSEKTNIPEKAIDEVSLYDLGATALFARYVLGQRNPKIKEHRELANYYAEDKEELDMHRRHIADLAAKGIWGMHDEIQKYLLKGNQIHFQGMAAEAKRIHKRYLERAEKEGKKVWLPVAAHGYSFFIGEKKPGKAEKGTYYTPIRFLIKIDEKNLKTVYPGPQEILVGDFYGMIFRKLAENAFKNGTPMTVPREKG